MKKRIFALVVLLFSLPVSAQDSLTLGHVLQSVDSIDQGTRLNFRLTISNKGSHQYHDVRLQLEDVSLSLNTESSWLEFQTLAAGTSKSRNFSVTSNLPAGQLQNPNLMLFHLQAVDESGHTVSHLLRSSGGQP